MVAGNFFFFYILLDHNILVENLMDCLYGLYNHL